LAANALQPCCLLWVETLRSDATAGAHGTSHCTEQWGSRKEHAMTLGIWGAIIMIAFALLVGIVAQKLLNVKRFVRH